MPLFCAITTTRSGFRSWSRHGHRHATPQSRIPGSVAHFSSADPVLALCEHGKKLAVIRLEPSDPAHARWIAAANERWGLDAARITSPSAAAAPLISGGVTTGQLTCMKFRRKKWRTDELNTDPDRRIPAGATAGPHRRRREASRPRGARRSDRPAQPPRADRTPLRTTRCGAARSRPGVVPRP